MIRQIISNQDMALKKRPLWKIDKRVELLKKLHWVINQNSELISTALNKDLGKSKFESYVSEIDFVLAEITYALKKIKKWAKPKRVGSPLPFYPAKSAIYPTPLGKVLIISPWNYPFMLTLSPLIGALAAGNQAILKPSEVSSHTAKIIHKIISENFDPSLIAVCLGAVDETTELLQHKFDHIFYTGNGFVGKIILESAAKYLTPVTLELGGKSPCLVFTDDRAKLDLATKRIIWGKFFNCGQTCVAPDYVIIPSSLKKEFIQAAKKWISHFYGENPLDSCDYGKIINSRHYDRLTSLYVPEDVLVGNITAPGRISPTLLNANFDSPVMQNEIFGPLLPIIEIDSFDEAIDYIASKDKPLAAYGFFTDKRLEKQFITEISCGGMTINDTIVHLSNKHLPFGGIGASGMGHYLGAYSFKTFTHYKSVMCRSFALENSLRYPPYKSKLNLIRRIMSWFGQSL